MLMEERPRKVSGEKAGCSVYSSISQTEGDDHICYQGGRAVTETSKICCCSSHTKLSVCEQNDANKSLVQSTKSTCVTRELVWHITHLP